MAKYEILISSTAEKTLKKIPKKDTKKLVDEINKLAIDPRPTGCRKLSGHDDAYRVRVGVYRIIYRVEDKVLCVLVLKIGHRKDVYR